jgi:type IV pilus assembly protein PilB
VCFVARAGALGAKPHGNTLRGAPDGGYHAAGTREREAKKTTLRASGHAEISRLGAALAYDVTIVAKRIGELLVEAGVLSQSQLEQALFAQRKDGRKLGQLLIELGLASEIQLTQTLSRQLSVPWVSLYHVDFSRSLLNLVAREAAEKYCLVPIFVRRVRKQGETLYVAMDDPTNDAAIEDVARASAMPVKPMIACPSDIRAAIRVYYLGETAAPPPPAPASTPQVAGGPPPSSTQLGPRPAPAPAPAPPAVPERPKERRPPPEPSAAEPAPTRLRVASVPDAKESLPDSRAPQPSQPAEGEVRAPKRMRPRMISLTLLDGTSISIPAPGNKQPSKPDIDAPPREASVSDQLTARDLVSALRAVSHGVDASEILGTEPKWEALFSALLSILLRKGIIADWEFIEEFRKV